MHYDPTVFLSQGIITPQTPAEHLTQRHMAQPTVPSQQSVMVRSPTPPRGTQSALHVPAWQADRLLGDTQSCSHCNGRFPTSSAGSLWSEAGAGKRTPQWCEVCSLKVITSEERERKNIMGAECLLRQVSTYVLRLRVIMRETWLSCTRGIYNFFN